MATPYQPRMATSTNTSGTKVRRVFVMQRFLIPVISTAANHHQQRVVAQPQVTSVAATIPSQPLLLFPHTPLTLSSHYTGLTLISHYIGVKL